MTRSFLLVLAVLFLVAGCGPARSAALLGGPDAVALISQPGSATTAYRIDGGPGLPKITDGRAIGQYPIRSGPVRIDEATRAELAAVLMDDGTYLDGIGKLCAFSPGVALRFADASTTVDVLLCFSCDQLKVWKDGASVGGGYFDHGRDDLVAIVKRLFPEDEGIQKL